MAEEGERREGGEGPTEDAEFAEYVEYLREKYPEGGIKDDEFARRPHEKESAQSEESAESSSERARGNHAEHPDDNEVKEGDAGRLEADNEGGRDEEFERLWERIKKRLESQAADERHGLDQERRNSGNGPPEERTPDDIKEEPKAPSEQLSRESEAVQNPELDGPSARIGENRTDPVGENESQGDIRQDIKQDGRISIESSAADRNEASSEIEGKIEISDNDKGPVETPRADTSIEPLQLGIPKGPDDSGGTPEIGSGIHDYAAKSSEGQLPSEENIVSNRDVVDANEELRPASEALQGRVESNLVRTAGMMEEPRSSNLGDSNDYRLGAAKETKSGVDSTFPESNTSLSKRAERREVTLRQSESRPNTMVGAGDSRGKEIADIAKSGDFGNSLRALDAMAGEIRNKHEDRVPYGTKKLVEGVRTAAKARPVRSDPPAVCFDVTKSRIERQTGVKMEKNKLYRITGTVEGTHNFEVYRMATRSRIRLYVPLGDSHRLEPGKVYSVSITSMKEKPLSEEHREIAEWSTHGGPWRRTLAGIKFDSAGYPVKPSEPAESKKTYAEAAAPSLPEKSELLENITATFSVEARRASRTRPQCYFRVDNSTFEKRTGMRIEEGRSYGIKGTIEGAGDFQRTLWRYNAKQDVRIFVPIELYSRVEAGRRYEITINSIQKLPARALRWQGDDQLRRASPNRRLAIDYLNKKGREVGWASPDDVKENGQKRVAREELPKRAEAGGVSFDLVAKLIQANHDRIYFEIRNRTLREKIRTELEANESYRIKGRIEGVCEFEKLLEKPTVKQIKFYPPLKYENQIKAGEVYRMTIDTIEKEEKKHETWMLVDNPDSGRGWDWKDVASWVDTEGTILIHTNRGGRYDVAICQKERKVMEELGRYLYREHFPVSMNLQKNTGVYTLHVSGAENVARLTKEIEPYIRTENKKEEIDALKESLMKPRKLLWPSIRKAREILGLNPSADDPYGL